MITAFTVLINDEGAAQAVLEIPQGLSAARQPTVYDLRRALLEITADLAAQAAGQYARTYLATPEEESAAERVASALAKRRDET